MESISTFTAPQLDLYERLIKAERNFRKTGKDKIKKPLVETRLETVEELWKDFRTGHKELIANTTKEQRDKEEYFKNDIYDQFQEQYQSYKTLLKEIYQTFLTVESHPKKTIASKSDCNEVVRLPRIELPSFNGKYSDWQTFYDMFSSVIHENTSLPPVQKLHYLKSCLSGEPELLIRNFSTTDANYTEAWEQLLKRYNNKKYNCNSILQTLFSLKTIQSESSTALKNLLDTASSCLKSLDNIGVKTDSWDAIIVFMIISKLDHESRKQWEYQVSMMEELPTWVQLVEFIESRFKSLEMIESSRTINKNVSQSAKQSVKTKSFNATVEEEKKNSTTCPCCNGSHHICHCKQFGSKQVQDRFNFVQGKRLCFNCLGSNHSIKNCRQTTNCRKCGRRHHTLLHVTKDQEGATSNTTTPNTNSNTMMTTERAQQSIAAIATPSDTHIVANFSKNERHEELKCEEIFEATTVRENDGRYKVRLPFKSEEPECQYGEHRKIAQKRLEYLERKLEKRSKLYEDYRIVIDEYMELGHMRPVVKEDIDNSKAVYLPHHAVIREDKLTTKVRVVFDASCKGVNNVALNDDLLVGPKLQQDLRHLLMQWRTHKICIIADLVKMYRQVRVADEDINYQRILWRSNPSDEMQHFNLLTLTFGTACAPYLAVKSLQRLADDEQSKYPIAAEITKNDYYMDDLMTGCNSEVEAIQIYEEMNKLMNAGGFELQKWSSNSKKFLDYIDKNKHRTNNSIVIQQDKKGKVLGICWNKETDNFEYAINLPEVKGKFTKRQVVSDIARLYDPVGWIQPIVIVGKLFIQKLWKSELDWDDDLTEDLSTEWTRFREELKQVENICIPRWLNFSPGYKRELHAFSDASMSAYAGCVYLRVIDDNDHVSVNLLTAKTKVAPIERELSVPRLELSGAVLATKLLSEVAEVMGTPKENLYAWTDSTVVLAWLKGPACRWTTFVSNRVSEILSMTDFEQWSHVSTHMNPSDCASRGLEPGELAEHSLWWHGPTWLKEPSLKKEIVAVIDTHEEEKVKALCTLQQPDKTDKPWERFSSLTKMLKVLSFCRRILNLKKPKSDRKNMKDYVTSEEINQTLKKCIKEVQQHKFQEEIKHLKARH